MECYRRLVGQGQLLALLGIALLWACFALLAAPPSWAEVIHLGRLTVYSAEELNRFTVTENGSKCLALPGARKWVLLEDGGPYSPMPTDEVLAAINCIDYPVETLEGILVILAVPRRDLLESSTEGRVIFLSPGRADWPREHVHYTVAHEMGHLVHNALMPDSREDLWREYARLRGLDFEAARDAREHASRLHEIFAEDFRMLFGSDLARCSSGVEDHDLSLPDAVQGLREFFTELPSRAQTEVHLTVSPNPFRGCTLIEAVSGAAAMPIDQVLILDVTGRIVADLQPSGATRGQVVWDGLSRDGQPAAPGTYFLALRTGVGLQLRKITKIGE